MSRQIYSQSRGASRSALRGETRHAWVPTCEVEFQDAQPPSLRDAAHRLAMLALQSKRYGADPDYRDAVDNVLAHTASRSTRALRSAIRASHPTPEGGPR